MPSSLSLGLNLVSLVVFVLPGLAGVKLGLLIADRADWLNRVDTIALSFGVSILSMGGVYFWYSLLNGHLLRFAELSSVWSHLPTAITVYLQLLGTSLGVGVLLGVLDFGGDHVAKREGLWYTFFSEVESKTDSEEYQVRVRMQSGDELWGRVEDNGEISVNRDILLENPRRVIRGEDGSIGDTYRYTGTAYLHNQGITHIEFDRLKTADAVGRDESNLDTSRKETRPESDTTDDSADAGSVEDAEIEELEEFAEEADEERSGQETDTDEKNPE
ncbi:DUF6338 family protein [Halorussus pelagicus]|uniref:DUF6338 family protein n=1 Tax=Halorussus pelagicus TaxID=2505977 RepID=UPI001FB714A0|nr:DUF6338 family protein [Halorussus pelagicus]